MQIESIQEPETPDHPEQTSEMPVLSSSPLRVVKRSSAIDFWSDNSVVKEIEEKFPGAERGWVEEMASFDVDVFFEQMGDFMAARGSLQGGHQRRVGMETIMEAVEENGYHPNMDDTYIEMTGPEMVGRFERDETDGGQVRTHRTHGAVNVTLDEDDYDFGWRFEQDEDGAQHLDTGGQKVVMKFGEADDDHMGSNGALVGNECAASTNPFLMDRFVPMFSDVMND